MPFVCFRIHDCAAKLPFVCIRKPHRPPCGCALPFWLTYSIYSFLFNYGVSASRPAQIPKDLGTKHEMLCIGGSRGRLPNTFLISPVYLCYKKHAFVYLHFHYRFDFVFYNTSLKFARPQRVWPIIQRYSSWPLTRHYKEKQNEFIENSSKLVRNCKEKFGNLIKILDFISKTPF